MHFLQSSIQNFVKWFNAEAFLLEIWPLETFGSILFSKDRPLFNKDLSLIYKGSSLS